MISSQPILTQEDLDAYLQKSGYSGSVFSGNPRLAWHLLPLFTAITAGLIRIDPKIKF